MPRPEPRRPLARARSRDHVAHGCFGRDAPALPALVVDAGCGTGRYVAGLAALGFRVIAVDRSEALLEHARVRDSTAEVLNDLTGDDDRRAAFASFAAWLAPGGVLLADVRDREATAARYEAAHRHEREVARCGRVLRYASETRLDAAGRRMLIRERYAGAIDGVAFDASYDFVMRCWSAHELRELASGVGFVDLEVRSGADIGLAPDRLLLTAARGAR